MARVDKTVETKTYRHDRGWGYEVWVENLPDYCGKLLYITKGKRGSMHFHVNKLETMYLEYGQIDIRFIDPDDGKQYTIHLNPGDSIRIPRGQVHQIVGVEESKLIEFSTLHEENDSYRVVKGD
ncbi:MAG: cupin domain-containing protein [Candidatus Thorarchaeota archaeon]|jgi:oxalate decarboxylase/phosphoglucose isomerase-like protein (cupin superfamily)